MKRTHNSQFSFETVPTIRRSRTRLPIKYDTKTAFSVGRLIPYDVKEVYPGDTWTMQDTFVMRGTSTFLKPVMDNLFLDMYHFFVPCRLLQEHWSEVVAGGEEPNEWTTPTARKVPSMSNFTVPEDTVGDYLGLPTKVNIKASVSILPYRAFAKIYNDWFRDENNQHSVYLHTEDTKATTETPNSNEWDVNNYFGKCPMAGKFKDYFTSALPAPQKGLAVNVLPANALPVIAQDFTHDMGNNLRLGGDSITDGNTYLFGNSWITSGEQTDFELQGMALSDTSFGNFDGSRINFSNLAVDGNSLTFSVSDLRLYTQLQRILERSARGGSRYSEYLLSTFGVQAPDASLQRSEYLGGKRMPLNQQQVAQTSQGTEISPLGSLASFSHSQGQTSYSKGFVEHGFIISCAVIRYRHTYQQGIQKFWRRLERFDFYDPAFVNLSEQPIMATELYGQAEPDDIFGYAEAWAELRQLPNKVTGAMRSNHSTSYDLYHYADLYSNTPVLSADFIKETPTFVDRTLAVPSTSTPSFIFDIFHSGYAIRELTPYSIPGLLDHN